MELNQKAMDRLVKQFLIDLEANEIAEELILVSNYGILHKHMNISFETKKYLKMKFDQVVEPFVIEACQFPFEVFFISFKENFGLANLFKFVKLFENKKMMQLLSQADI